MTSAGVHLLLAVILLIDPGVVSSKSKPDDSPILNFVPIKTVDELVAPGGGNPKAQPLPIAPALQPPQPQPQAASPPPPPKPQPQPEKAREPDPPKDIKPVKPEEASLEPAKETKKIEISTKLVSRPKDSNSDKKVREDAQAREEAKAQADARRRLARQIGRAAEHIGSELSSSTAVELQGPGGGGVPYANWRQAVKSKYSDAWLLPDGAVDDEATTEVSITIARDGTVVSRRITKPSGDPVVDRSVQAALDRVPRVPPLPDNSKENKRTVTINFNVKAKRSLG